MIRRWVAFVAAFFFACLACVFFACGGSQFIAGGEDGGALDAGDAGLVDSAPPRHDASGVDAGPQSSGIVYVSAEAGADTNSGLSPAVPKKTLVAALATAIALDAGAEVHACAGTYAETQLDLNGAVSLRGAYDCATWIRTATFGYPTFDHANDTIVENANPAAQGETLGVSGTVPSTNVVDGFTIVGAAVLDGTTTGVLFRAEASPVLRDSVITGGGGQQTSGFGSIGVYIDDDSSAEVVNDSINGGTGTPGSVGVQIRSTATPHVHDALVSGGLGTDPIGIYVQSGVSGVDSLFGLAVAGCDSPGASGSSSAIQINAPDAGVDVVSSLVNGCAGVADAGASSVGIRVSSVGTLNVLEDRVFGGTRSGTDAFVAGVQVVAATTATVRNSMLHAGDVTGGSANGLSLVAAGSANIQDDTIYAGAQNGTSIVLLEGAQDVRISDVIFLGGGTDQTHPGVFAQSCSGALRTLDHDLFANFAAPIFACNLPDGGEGPFAFTPQQLEALLPVASADLDYASTAACDDDAGDCIPSAPCPGTPMACLGSLFGSSWTPDDGITGLFPSPDGGSPGGWTLPVGTPCAIAQGGVPVAGISTDLYGNPRNPTTPTIGAAELLDSGTCP